MHFSQTIQNKDSDFKILNNEEIVCSCHSVDLSVIKMAMHSGNAKTIDDITELTNAGKGCKACICKVERILTGQSIKCGDCSFCIGCGLIAKICKCA
jgi:NAD(P)H-nitrite reductase large subunit